MAQAQKDLRHRFLTLYYQNIKPKGVNPPQSASLYSYPNEQLAKKSSTLGS
jgi:hypothetical protein